MPNSNSTPETKTCKKCGNVFPKTSEYFHNQDTCKDGLRPECKQCHAERHKAWRETHKEEKQTMDKRWREENAERKRANDKAYYEANKELIGKQGREYRLKNADTIRVRRRGYYAKNAEANRERNKIYRNKNKDRLAQKQVEYRKTHPRQRRDSDREYRETHIEEIRERNRQWKANNPHTVRIKEQRRRARVRNLPNTFTVQEWNVCLEYFHYTCAVCGCQLRDLLGDVEPHADHWIPIASELCTGTIASNIVCLCNTCNLSKNAKLPEQWLIERYGKRKANEIMKQVQDYFDSLGD